MSLGTPSPTGAPAARGQQTQPGDEKLHGLPAAESQPPLQKIAVVELAGDRFDLARNGGFHLVQGCEDDAYGRPVARPVDLSTYFLRYDGTLDHKRAQALLDAYGEALVRLQGQRDLRLGGEGGEP